MDTRQPHLPDQGALDPPPDAPLSIEAAGNESANDNGPEHRIGLEVGLCW